MCEREKEEQQGTQGERMEEEGRGEWEEVPYCCLGEEQEYEVIHQET